MGLAASQSRYLFLTDRKSDLEYNISIDSVEKMALVREQSALSQDYYNKLQSKKIAYYANGNYNKMSYKYLMGYSADYTAITQGTSPIKKDNSMILTDSNGRVVISSNYEKAMTKVLGSSCLDSKGRGGTFSVEKIPEILAEFLHGDQFFSAEVIKTVHDGGDVPSEYASTAVNILSGTTGESSTTDNTAKATQLVKQVIDFYYPIFQAAAANGWTTEYNEDMEHNSDYVSDALTSGVFQLAQVDEYGGYDPETSLTYFIMHGLVNEKNDAEAREEITAWYNAEKARISEKESWIDLEMTDLSTELEAVNTEMESIKKFIDDAMKVFEWGG